VRSTDFSRLEFPTRVCLLFFNHRCEWFEAAAQPRSGASWKGLPRGWPEPGGVSFLFPHLGRHVVGQQHPRRDATMEEPNRRRLVSNLRDTEAARVGRLARGVKRCLSCGECHLRPLYALRNLARTEHCGVHPNTVSNWVPGTDTSTGVDIASGSAGATPQVVLSKPLFAWARHSIRSVSWPCRHGFWLCAILMV
jgi:hypothetical protein